MIGYDKTTAERTANPDVYTMVSVLISDTRLGTYGPGLNDSVVAYVSVANGAPQPINWVWSWWPAANLREGNGSITFSTLNSATGASGTFSYTTGATSPNGAGTPAKVVTNGAFNISF